MARRRRGLGRKDSGVLLFIIIQNRLCIFEIHSGTQESFLAKYPFYQIRKDRQNGEPLWHKIRSISYSSSPAMRSGGGVGKFGPCTSFS